MPARNPSTVPVAVDLGTHPGHLIRRVAQVHTRLWQAMVSETVTSPQFAVLNGVAARTDVDQRTLGAMVSLDRSTVADVVGRLAGKGLLERGRDSTDARRNTLRLTAQGRAMHRKLVARTAMLNETLLGGLDTEQRSALLHALHRLATWGENRLDGVRGDDIGSPERGANSA
ncbi:MAG: MarR family winged helix-turn-helix transcriptional regulator [Sciscionella sp.]